MSNAPRRMEEASFMTIDLYRINYYSNIGHDPFSPNDMKTKASQHMLQICSFHTNHMLY